MVYRGERCADCACMLCEPCVLLVGLATRCSSCARRWRLRAAAKALASSVAIAVVVVGIGWGLRGFERRSPSVPACDLEAEVINAERLLERLHGQAAGTARAAVDRCGADMQLLWILFRAHVAQDSWMAARSDAATMAGVAPERAETWLARAIIEWHDGHLGEALCHGQTAVEKANRVALRHQAADLVVELFEKRGAPCEDSDLARWLRALEPDDTARAAYTDALRARWHCEGKP